MTILPPKGKRKSFYYDFQHEGKRYTKGGFKTAGKAALDEEKKKNELKKGETSTQTVMVSFLQSVNMYLDWCRRKFSDKTQKYKAYVYREFGKFAGDLPLPAISITLLEKYLDTRTTNTNYNRHRRELCALLRWAWKRRMFPEDICAFLETMPEPRFIRKIYTQEETVKLLLASGEFRAFLLTLYSLAARVGEINRLRWEDVNFEKREVGLWTRKRTGVWRVQVKAMNEDLYGELTKLYGKRSGEWVFPNPETGKPFVDRRKQLKRICRVAEVNYLGFHAIRHSVASLLADVHKISLPTLQKILGHSRLTTTEKYVRSLGDGEREAAEFLTIPANSPANKNAIRSKCGGDEGI